eukprot:gene11066-3133_t
MASNPKSPASSTGKNSVVESSVNNSSSDMIQNAEKVHDGSQSRPQSHSNRNSSQSSILRKPLPPIGSRMDVLPPNLQAVMDQLKLQTVTWISKFRDTINQAESSLQDDLSAAENQFASSYTSLDEYNSERLETLDADNKALRALTTELQTSMSSMEQKLKDMTKKIEDQQEELQASSHIQQLLSERDERIQQLQQQLSVAEASRDQALTDASSCKDTVKRLEAKLKQATSDATMHEHEFDKAQTTISELQEKIKTQQDAIFERDKLANLNRKLRSDISSTKSELASTASSLTEAQNNLSNERQIIVQLQQKLKFEKSKLSKQHSEELSARIQEINDLQTENVHTLSIPHCTFISCLSSIIPVLKEKLREIITQLRANREASPMDEEMKRLFRANRAEKKRLARIRPSTDSKY